MGVKMKCTLDGNQLCITQDNFVDLQESDACFIELRESDIKNITFFMHVHKGDGI